MMRRKWVLREDESEGAREGQSTPARLITRQAQGRRRWTGRGMEYEFTAQAIPISETQVPWALPSFSQSAAGEAWRPLALTAYEYLTSRSDQPERGTK